MVIVLIGGPAGSGKTTLAEAVKLIVEGQGKSVHMMRADPDEDIDAMSEQIEAIAEIVGPDVLICEGVSLC